VPPGPRVPNPNEEYDAAVRQFISRLLPGTADDPFFEDLLAVQRRVAFRRGRAKSAKNQTRPVTIPFLLGM
jgi:maltooligosyltrehalose synthase